MMDIKTARKVLINAARLIYNDEEKFSCEAIQKQYKISQSWNDLIDLRNDYVRSFNNNQFLTCWPGLYYPGFNRHINKRKWKQSKQLRIMLLLMYRESLNYQEE